MDRIHLQEDYLRILLWNWREFFSYLSTTRELYNREFSFSS